MATKKQIVSKQILSKAYELICTARAMSDIYEENKEITSKYVHAFRQKNTVPFRGKRKLTGIQECLCIWTANTPKSNICELCLGRLCK